MPENYKLASIRVDPPSVPAILESGMLVQGTDESPTFYVSGKSEFADIGLPVGAIPLSYVTFPERNPMYASAGILYFLVPTSSVKEV